MRYIVIIVLYAFLISCEERVNAPLPKIGKVQIVDGDTLFHKIPDFEMINQDSNVINNESLANHIYLADFFFTHCPSICPKVTKQMLRIYDQFEDEPMVKLVSYTLDPVRDTIGRLKEYAEGIDVSSEKWHFLTGDKDLIYDLADEYFVVAYEDPEAPGGFDHSGKILLVDKDRHIRGFAEGTDPEDVTELLKTIQALLDVYKE